MEKYWIFVKTFWFRILALFIIGLTSISDLLGLDEYLVAGLTYYNKLLEEPKILIGCGLLVLIIIVIATFVGQLLHMLLINAPFDLNVILAQNFATRGFSKHLNNAIKYSRPNGWNWRKKWRWNKLAASALKGIADEEVLNTFCERGMPHLPMISCNFQVYAHVVATVLKQLNSIHANQPYPQVWTVLRKPVTDWYNTFAVEWSDKDGHIIRGKVTFDWWEMYKNDIKVICNKGTGVLFHRIVADPEKQNALNFNPYYLYSSQPIALSDAIIEAKKFDGTVEWHSDISQLLKASSLSKKAEKMLIYLIGKPISNITPTEDCHILKHFEDHYHHGRRNPAPTDIGVYVQYFPNNAKMEERLDVYDDIFLVKFNEHEGFGLAFIDDENLDINGIRFLPQAELRLQKEHEGVDKSIFFHLSNAWNISLL